MTHVDGLHVASLLDAGSYAIPGLSSVSETAAGVGIKLHLSGHAVHPGSTYTYTNTGSISGDNAPNQYSNAAGGTGGDGFDLKPTTSLYNSGTISGGNGGGTYEQSGSGGVGVDIQGATVLNTGLIEGGAGGNEISSYFYDHNARYGSGGNGGAGVYLNGGTLITSGTIIGGAAGSGAYVYVPGSGGYTANGRAGAAIQFGTLASTLVVEAGAVFGGAVLANAAAHDTLVLASGIGGTLGVFTGFTNVVEQAGGNWTIGGDLSSQSLIVAGSLSVAGTLEIGASLAGMVMLDTGATLIDHAGADLNLASQVELSGNDTLVLASGPVTGIAYNLSTAVSGYSSIEIASGAHWIFRGTDVIQAGSQLAVAGSLYVRDALTIFGTLSVSGPLAGYGHEITLAAGATLIDNAGAKIAFGEISNQGHESLVLQGTDGLIYGLGGRISGFTTITEAAGSSWTATGYNAIAAGVTFNEAGALTIEGRLAVSGALNVSGTLNVAGVLVGNITLDQGATLIDNAGTDIRFSDITDAGGNTLILAAAASSGTLSGLGTSHENFATIVEQSGATWLLAGQNEIATGTTFIGGGTLDLSGTLRNLGLMTGVTGGNDGAGSIGVNLLGGVLINHGEIAGGNGNNGHEYFTYHYRFGQAGQNGGAGISLDGTTLVNDSTILGGAGGTGSYYRNFRGDYKKFANGNGGNGIDAQGGGTIVNAGIIAGGGGNTAGIGVDLNGGTLITSGTISGSDAVVFGAIASTLVIESGAIFNGAVIGNGVNDILTLGGTSPGSIGGLGTSISGFDLYQEKAGSMWTLTGANTLEPGATLAVAGTLAVQDKLTIGGNATIDAHGTIDGSGAITFLAALDNNGTISATGTLIVTGALSGVGTIAIGAGAHVLLQGSAAAGQHITFAGTQTGELSLDKPGNFAATLNDFASGNQIDLLKTSETSYVYTEGHSQAVLLIEDNGAVVADLHFAGPLLPSGFTITSDTHGGVLLTGT